MTPLKEVSRIFREALAIHDILGMFVDPKYIFVSFDPVAGHFLVVAKEGELEGAVRVGEIRNMTREQFTEEWDAAVASYNAAPRIERAELLEESKAREQAVSIIAGLVDRGFTLLTERKRTA